MILQNPRTIQGQKGTFFKFQDHGQIQGLFQVCANTAYIPVDLILFDLIFYVHSTIFQLCGTGLPGLNQY